MARDDGDCCLMAAGNTSVEKEAIRQEGLYNVETYVRRRGCVGGEGVRSGQ